MLIRMLKCYKVVAGTFHAWISPLATFGGLCILHITVSIGLVLDYIFFPSLRHIRIEKPIVIVGNPRSGTTFLQRFLVENGFGTGMRIWKMLYPSLMLQVLLKPLLPLLERISPARFHTKVAHETSLTDIETDDPALMFRYFDGLFLYGFFLAWAKEDPRAMFDPEVRDTSDRDFQWLQKMWKRNLISEKQNRMVSKLFSLGLRIPSFLKKFPDTKLLYMVRDPLQAVPSGLSLVTEVLDNRFGFWNLPDEKRKQYIERLYSAFLELSLRFYKHYREGSIPKENIMIIPYHRIMNDFNNIMKEIIEFVEITPSSSLRNTIQVTAEKQRKYKSMHKYSLKKFGLTESRIRNDYDSIYKTFL